MGPIKNHIKYATEITCPVRMYGSSTGRAPIQVNKKTVEIKDQKMSLPKGKKEAPRIRSLL